MSDLSEGGKALVRAGRQADRPNDADRERVLAQLRARLGDAALLAAAVVQAPPASSRLLTRANLLRWGWVGPTVLVAGAVWLAPHAAHQREPTPAVHASAVSAPNPPPAVEVSAAPSVPVGPSAQPADVSLPRAESAEGATRAVDPQKTPPRSRDSLAEEVALLSRAETELHAGRPAKALSALAEHQRKFPRGALAEERTAARIQALCALGRSEEANAQLRQLLHISPNSPQEERARQACRAPR